MSNVPMIINFSPTQEVPPEAPPLKIDTSNPYLSFDDVITKQYLSMDALTNWLAARDAESRIVTITHISMEYIYNPEKQSKKDGDWKPVVWFDEIESGLPINQTRGRQLTALAGGDQRLAAWSVLGQVTIRPAIADGNAQIVFGRVPVANGSNGRASTVPPDYDYTAANDDLFPA